MPHEVDLYFELIKKKKVKIKLAKNKVYNTKIR